MLFAIVGVIWLSSKPVLAHASCVSSTLLASVKSVNIKRTEHRSNLGDEQASACSGRPE